MMIQYRAKNRFGTVGAWPVQGGLIRLFGPVGKLLLRTAARTCFRALPSMKHPTCRKEATVEAQLALPQTEIVALDDKKIRLCARFFCYIFCAPLLQLNEDKS